MKVLVDENIPRMTVNRLRELGHDVRDVRGTAEQGLGDPDRQRVRLRSGRLEAPRCEAAGRRKCAT